MPWPFTLPSRSISVAPTGNSGASGIDSANMQNAVNAALANYVAGVGSTAVNLQAGTFRVNSFGRVDPSVTFVSGTTWTDTAMTAADVTRAAAGNLYLLSTSPNQRTLRIVTVTPGVGFTTDIAPASGVSAQPSLITQPGLVVPSGRVDLLGYGGVAANITGNFNSTLSYYGTGILDSGNGVSVMMRGSDTLGTQGKVRDLVVWGGPGVLGSALVGIYVGNSCWLLDIEDVDTSWQAQAGVAADGNVNTLTLRRWTSSNVGSAGTTIVTGGALIGYYTVVTSAAVRFESCVIGNLFGMGIGAFFPGNIGALASKIVDTQIYDISQTPSSPLHAGGYDGVAAVLQAGSTSASVIDHSWFGTNNGGDLVLNSGHLECLHSAFATNTVAFPIVSRGNLGLKSCDFSPGGSITACINQAGGNVTYDDVNSAGHPLTATIGATVPGYQGSTAAGEAILTKTATYTQAIGDPRNIIYTISAAATHTLPSAVTAGAGYKQTVTNANASTSALTLAATAGTVPTASVAAGTAVTVVSDGTNWQRGA